MLKQFLASADALYLVSLELSSLSGPASPAGFDAIDATGVLWSRLLLSAKLWST